MVNAGTAHLNNLCEIKEGLEKGPEEQNQRMRGKVVRQGETDATPQRVRGVAVPQRVRGIAESAILSKRLAIAKALRLSQPIRKEIFSR